MAGFVIIIILISAALYFFVFFKKEPPEYFFQVDLPEEKRQELNDRKNKNFEALELFPNNYNVYMDLGNIERTLGNASKAIEYFKKAWEIIPTNSTPWLNIGNVYIRLGMYQEAEQAFLKGIEVNSSYYFTYYNLAKLYRDYFPGKDEAINKIYLEGLQKTGNDYQLLQFYSDYLVEKQNYSEALKYLNLLYDKVPAENRNQVAERIKYVTELNQNK